MGGECGREVVGKMEWSEGGEWDNCNSIINKYINKKIIGIPSKSRICVTEIV